MERYERNEDLQSRFRELAARLDRIHTEWQDAASRGDSAAESRLIQEEAELLAKADQIVKEFRDRVTGRLSSRK